MIRPSNNVPRTRQIPKISICMFRHYDKSNIVEIFWTSDGQTKTDSRIEEPPLTAFIRAFRSYYASWYFQNDFAITTRSLALVRIKREARNSSIFHSTTDNNLHRVWCNIKGCKLRSFRSVSRQIIRRKRARIIPNVIYIRKTSQQIVKIFNSFSRFGFLRYSNNIRQLVKQVIHLH